MRVHRAWAPALVAALAVVAAGAPGAEAKTTWLCKPGAERNPCETGLDTTRVSVDGEVLGVREAERPRRPSVDCFYVYPTVSNDPGANSDLVPGPEERFVARYQAARFSEHCRVFAPMYRQLTRGAISGAEPLTAEAALLAYGDVLAAWRSYLDRRNRGRGVVLIGHSQGTYHLRNLIRGEIDPYPAARRRLVSAVLIGGNVLVDRGELTGEFARLPGCTEPAEVRCVIAYSAFNEPVPEDARFGRPGSGFFPGDPETDEVLCTDPTALSRSSGSALRLTFPTKPLPEGSTLGGGGLSPAPSVADLETPWVEVRRAYAADCSHADGASVLQVSDLPGAPHLRPTPTPSWGLHTIEVNLALGDLAEAVGDQARAYAAKRR